MSLPARQRSLRKKRSDAAMPRRASHSQAPRLPKTFKVAPQSDLWPVPPSNVLPFTQIFAHVASTSIMVLLVLFSYYEDLSRWTRRKLGLSPVAQPHVLPDSTPLTSDAQHPADLHRPHPRPSRPATPRDMDSDEGASSSTTAFNDTSSDASSSLDDSPRSPPRPRRPSRRSFTLPSHDSSLFYSTRRTTMHVGDYCSHAGYSCDTFETITEDGFVLFAHRVGKQGGGGVHGSKGPVILMHGLFQSSGVWVTSGMDSLAFFLVDQGYDVWMGNNRTSIEQHAVLKPSDAKFWDWSLDELARYDFPAIVDLVRRETKYDKVAFVGHSQGNAQAFLSMQQNPAVCSKLSIFVALAPAVYIGSLLETFPVCLLMECPASLFRRLFGVKAFLPIMSVVQVYFPPYIFAALAYHMFHYLFGWTDTNWDPRNKSSYFQFTPRPQSSKALHHWAQMGKAGVIGAFHSSPVPTRTPDAGGVPREYDVSCVRCPLVIYYGSRDTIVDGPKLHAA
ncbi:hypothetical protein HK101_000599, partial [Irineochytrium annulatum]